MADVQVPPATDVLGHTPLQQVIENQFNMQTLLKHNETRLIEQELAKCQVALEQLRRCELRPYPGAERPSVSVSDGTGVSIMPPLSHSQPSHPAPYGVVDGPYTRHYRQWLLHDPQFEPTPLHVLPPASIGAEAAARSTRGSNTARKSVQKSSTMPSRSGDPLHSLPNYPVSASKDKSAALVLRRSTDGQLVKLVCNNCQRGNFSSIQGFLNHCRIAHKVDYKSHDAAAVDCGRSLNELEAASLPPEALAAIAMHKPSGSRSTSTTTTPFKTQHLVHPMNLPGNGNGPTMVSQQVQVPKAPNPLPVRSLAPGASVLAHSTPLTPSLQAPRLSAQFAKYQLGGNLEQAIVAAKERVQIDADEDASSPDPVDTAFSSMPAMGSRTVFGTGRAGSLAPPGAASRPPSRKGHREVAQRHRPSPLVPASASLMPAPRHDHGEVPESPQDSSMNLSPHNLSPHTVDSEPGLVSDLEDDDHGSASEEEDEVQATIAHSLGLRGRGCSDNMDIDVEVGDGLNQHSVVIRRNSMLVGEDRGPSGKLGASGQGA
ncbi:hypothetical protein LTR08_007072 [Meristemomyces frigidus]|nr:hypothetical protein LTR08_007072 [Meristemomyces frigidus]